MYTSAEVALGHAGALYPCAVPAFVRSLKWQGWRCRRAGVSGFCSALVGSAVPDNSPALSDHLSPCLDGGL